MPAADNVQWVKPTAADDIRPLLRSPVEMVSPWPIDAEPHWRLAMTRRRLDARTLPPSMRIQTTEHSEEPERRSPVQGTNLVARNLKY